MARVNAALLAGVVCCIVSCFLPEASGAKILLSMTMVLSSVSQHILFSAITEPLVERGHEVILLAPKHKVMKGISDEGITGKIFFKNPRSKEDMDRITRGLNAAMIGFSQNSTSEIFKSAKDKLGLASEGCIRLFEDMDTLHRLDNEKFDLIITMPMVGCDALLAEYLGIPFVVMTPVRRVPGFNEGIFGIPAPSAYVPAGFFTTFTDRMTFFQRTANLVLSYTADPLMPALLSYPLKKIQRDMDIRPDLSVNQLLGRAQLWLCQSHVALEFAQPTVPNFVSIGGILARPAKPLPQEMEDFVQGSGDHGVIVFTLGSIVSTLMNDELTEKLAKVLGELPQRVLWRYKGTKPRNLGNNTLVSSWLPQNDLLAHPKTRLLIYHGGANGVYEAVGHGVPLLLMPLGADQMANAVRIEAKELGFAIEKNTLTEESFREALHEILGNPKYATNMKKASEIMKDQIVPTREKVTYYIEHILKFGGDHLRTRALELSFIQLHSIDVIVFLLAVSLVLLYAVKWLICTFCCRLCTSKTSKVKSD